MALTVDSPSGMWDATGWVGTFVGRHGEIFLLSFMIVSRVQLLCLEQRTDATRNHVPPSQRGGVP